ncbi:MAG: carboxypeptidase-like regulatory domain-containing protein, partial [Tannerella sp.]|nr:carboxypeptidase-like regulatory domain-containing protein [Tannerella sp.]
MKNKHMMKRPVNRKTKSLFFYLLIGILYFIHPDICAQSIQPPGSNMTLAELIQQIERQSDYLFIYNETEIDVKMKLPSLPLKTENVTSLLSAALANTPVHFLIENKNIILNTRKLQEEKQSILISGVVMDETGELLIGANVSIKGSSEGVITNVDGEFILNVESDAVLVVSYLGYIPQDIPVRNKTRLEVVLKEDSKTLEEVVVIGYGKLKRKEITGSHTSVKMNTIPPVGGATITQFLGGKAAGLTATVASAQPGGRVNLQIRGSASNRQPLIIVDGFPITSSFYNVSSGEFGAGDTDAVLASINPNDILSIDILKDASATSIYGSKAAGGVILITTKRGSGIEPRVEGIANVGWSHAYNIPDLLDATDFMYETNRAIKERFMYDNQIAPYGKRQWGEVGLPEYKDRYLPGDFETWKGRKGTNWFDEISRIGKVQNYGANIQGGIQSSKYYASFGYFSQEGVIKNNNYNKFTAQINIDQKFGEKATLGNGFAAWKLSSLHISNEKIKENSPIQVYFNSMSHTLFFSEA